MASWRVVAGSGGDSAVAVVVHSRVNSADARFQHGSKRALKGADPTVAEDTNQRLLCS